jgi:hypothetical protein
MLLHNHLAQEQLLSLLLFFFESILIPYVIIFFIILYIFNFTIVFKLNVVILIYK